jgi:hypothetical protein
VSETHLESVLRQRGFRPGPGGVDFSNDSGVVIEAKSAVGGVRDLQAAVMQLADAASEPGVREGWLLLAGHRMPESITDAWKNAVRLLRPELAKKLKLIAVSGKVITAIPDKPELLELGRRIGDLRQDDRPSKPYDAFFDVLHVLLVRWLLNQGAIQMRNLGATTGLSQPTVRAALHRLGPDLQRDSRRRVELTSFPRRAWQEMVALAPRIRQPRYFQDTSGRPRRPEELLERLRRQKPPGVAVGGVLAARHWDAELDLEGVPRLDLCVHAPNKTPSLSFMRKLDPALAPTDGRSSVSVAVHCIRRREPLYFDAEEKIPWADPVETLLDLEELRLHVQADELVRRLQKRAR